MPNTEEPIVMMGKPVMRGTLAHLSHNPDGDDLCGAYAELTVDDVEVYRRYAHVALP